MPDLPLIILVDDDEAARYLGQRLLRPYATRAQILVAGNGQEALYLLERYAAAPTVALVLLDINMPVMDGFEFLTVHNAWDPVRRHAIKVVMVSSSELEQDRRRAHSLGAGFLRKPLTPETIAAVLHEQLGQELPA